MPEDQESRRLVLAVRWRIRELKGWHLKGVVPPFGWPLLSKAARVIKGAMTGAELEKVASEPKVFPLWLTAPKVDELFPEYARENDIDAKTTAVASTCRQLIGQAITLYAKEKDEDKKKTHTQNKNKTTHKQKQNKTKIKQHTNKNKTKTKQHTNKNKHRIRKVPKHEI